MLLTGALLWSTACFADDTKGGSGESGSPATPPAAAEQPASAPVPPAAAEQPASAPVPPAGAAQPAAAAPPATAAQDVALPALRYNSDSVTNDLFDSIHHAPQFDKLSREAIGSPIELRVYHTYRIDRGAATATGFLAGVTLGLIPQVSSGNHSIVYEVLVNGVPVTSHTYSTSLTRVRNIWTQDKTYGLGEDGIKWARSTVDLFLKDAAADPKLAALRSEFNYYFGSAQVQ
ncbi:MAG: hypothetical protein JO133_02150 [Burkholderiaceae bacterium]|nr:hypothetical protein [Burkholderiaceae bacterium]